MRILDGQKKLVRIFVGDSDKWHHKPLDRALIEQLRKEGFAGVTVLRGIEGFGARSIIHTAGILDLSADLPLVIEVVDDDEHVERLLEILDEMLQGGGLVTVENVRVVKYSAGPPKAPETAKGG